MGRWFVQSALSIEHTTAIPIFHNLLEATLFFIELPHCLLDLLGWLHNPFEIARLDHSRNGLLKFIAIFQLCLTVLEKYVSSLQRTLIVYLYGILWNIWLVQWNRECVVNGTLNYARDKCRQFNRHTHVFNKILNLNSLVQWINAMEPCNSSMKQSIDSMNRQINWMEHCIDSLKHSISSLKHWNNSPKHWTQSFNHTFGLSETSH